MPHSALIPSDLDKRFRWAIVEYAKNIADLPATLSADLEKLLESDVRPEALDESKTEIKDLDQVLLRATRITGALAHFFGADDPEHKASLAFMKWLVTSGWGNDKRLILLFDAWYQEAQRRKVKRRIGKLNA